MFSCSTYNTKATSHWIAIGIRVSCRQKRSLYVLYRNCHSQKLKACYTQYFIILHKIIREAKKIYFNQLISLSDNKTKAIWNIVKTERGSKCHPDTMPSALEKENLVINLNQAAYAFNIFCLE
jgi:hypothetical protein